MGNDELFRVESAITAHASGNLNWGCWTHDAITALACAGIRNPLGFAVVRYLNDDFSALRVWDVHLHLVSELIRRGVEQSEANDAAKSAIGFWHDSRCRACDGRGVVVGRGVSCSKCGGTGHRRAPDAPEVLALAVSCLIEAEQWMENQLRARMRKCAA